MREIAALLFLCFNVIMAGHHANLIRDGKRIQHGLWGGAYLGLAVVFCYFGGQRDGIGFDWLLMIDLLLIRKVFFDLPLNLFRGKPMFYVSATTTSIIDKFHNRVFGLNSLPYMIVYFVAIIVITILL